MSESEGATQVTSARFLARYVLSGPSDEAREQASAIAVEQTIEFPADLVAQDHIRREVMGRVDRVEQRDPQTAVATISYPVATTGFELPQLLNVLFGNCSLLPGVRLVGITLPPELLGRFRGPRFGLDGMRNLLGVRTRPLLATALKPMGLDSRSLAEMAGTLARAGIDLIKDDHGLANQRFAEFSERVTACAQAVAEANQASGHRSLYLPSINAPANEIEERVRLAVDAGAGGLLIMPGLSSFDLMRHLADDDSLAVPIMSHPAFLGAFVTDRHGGIDHGTLFGTIMRLAGADMTVFPSYGGRFKFSAEECASIAQASRAPMESIEPILPVPAGGMTLARMEELMEFYGPDTVLLIGGNLQRGNLLDNATRMRARVDELEG